MIRAFSKKRSVPTDNKYCQMIMKLTEINKKKDKIYLIHWNATLEMMN